MIEQLMGYLRLAWQIFARPWSNPQTTWMVMPIVLILVLIHLYFGRYKSEELGWNSAFGNSVSLLWVCIILMNFLLERHRLSGLISDPEALKVLIIVLILTLWAITMLFFNFFHLLPKRLAFAVSSSDSVSVLAYIIISVILGGFELSLSTLIASLIVWVGAVAVLIMIKKITPGAEEWDDIF